MTVVLSNLEWDFLSVPMVEKATKSQTWDEEGYKGNDPSQGGKEGTETNHKSRGYREEIFFSHEGPYMEPHTGLDAQCYGDVKGDAACCPAVGGHEAVDGGGVGGSEQQQQQLARDLVEGFKRQFYPGKFHPQLLYFLQLLSLDQGFNSSHLCKSSEMLLVGFIIIDKQQRHQRGEDDHKNMMDDSSPYWHFSKQPR